MGQYCFARCRLSSVVCNATGGRAGRRARGRSGGRHCLAANNHDVRFEIFAEMLKPGYQTGLETKILTSISVSRFDLL